MQSPDSNIGRAARNISSDGKPYASRDDELVIFQVYLQHRVGRLAHDLVGDAVHDQVHQAGIDVNEMFRSKPADFSRNFAV